MTQEVLFALMVGITFVWSIVGYLLLSRENVRNNAYYTQKIYNLHAIIFEVINMFPPEKSRECLDNIKNKLEEG